MVSSRMLALFVGLVIVGIVSFAVAYVSGVLGGFEGSVDKQPVEFVFSGSQNISLGSLGPYQSIEDSILMWATMYQYSDRVECTFTVSTVNVADYYIELEFNSEHVILTPESIPATHTFSKGYETGDLEPKDWLIDLNYNITSGSEDGPVELTINYNCTALPP